MTQKLTRSEIMTLTRRYRDDRMFDIRRIYGTMSTNIIDTRCQSIHDEKYFQVIGDKQLFMDAYPIKKKSDCHLGFNQFVKEYGSPYKMTYDGAQEQTRRKNKPKMELLEDLVGDNEIFHDEFSRVITNEYIPEADNIFDTEGFDNYVNIKLALDRHADEP